MTLGLQVGSRSGNKTESSGSATLNKIATVNGLEYTLRTRTYLLI